MNNNQAEINPVDLLIITVGTRQVGWRCEDEVVRCLGADGGHGAPFHVGELYDILGFERGHYIEDDKKIKWSVKDLGKRFYQHCQEELHGDFSNVELLLDQEVIKDLHSKGLKHIILWATDQPENVPWQYRRNDTLWLAKLMEGKIKQIYPKVTVSVEHPEVHATNREEIRQVLENSILRDAVKKIQSQKEDEKFILAIQNKGSTPPFADSLEICAAALVRQCQVIIYTPIEPNDPYPEKSGRSASIADKCKWVSVSEYFWPLERSRVISAWEKGSFSEAKVWLESHTIKYGFLHDLAEYLSISSNWEFSSLVKKKKGPQEKTFEKNWLNSPKVSKQVNSKQLKEWRDRLKNIRADEYAQIWESTFFIYILLLGENYTGAFFQLAQTLERLLRVKCEKEPSLKEIAERLVLKKQRNYLTFEISIEAFFYSLTPKPKEKECELFHKIREKRNDLAHTANPTSLEELSNLWSDAGLEIDTSNPETILNDMQKAMERVIKSPSLIWNETMLYSLYKWGLDILKSEEINSQKPGN